LASDLAVGWVTASALAGIDVLRGSRLRVGRGEDCHFRLEHASVSRHHTELYRQGPIYALRDLGSTNGTWLNGHRVEHAALSAGDVLRFGDCLGIVFRLDPGVAPVQWASVAPVFWGGPALAD
jgi:pSer/pThr/pTyr-binding forkhead associated (FHA) protein